MRTGAAHRRGVRRSAGATPRDDANGRRPDRPRDRGAAPAAHVLRDAGDGAARPATGGRAHTRSAGRGRIRQTPRSTRSSTAGAVATKPRHPVTATEIDTGTEKMLARVEDGIGWMTYNNPERLNAMSVEMTLAVPRILAAFRDDPEVRVVVITGAGNRAFVSGADISEFGERRTSVDARAEYDTAMADAWRMWRELDKPILAMIRGYCIGGGLLTAMRADIRIAAEGSQFAVPAARLGLGYAFGGVEELVALVGAVVGRGDPVLRAAAVGRRGAPDRPGEPRRARSTSSRRRCASWHEPSPRTRRSRCWRARSRSARRGARRQIATEHSSTSSWRRASAPRTTSKGRPRSAKSASRAFAASESASRLAGASAAA